MCGIDTIVLKSVHCRPTQPIYDTMNFIILIRFTPLTDFDSRIFHPNDFRLKSVGWPSSIHFNFKNQEIYVTVGSREQCFGTPLGVFSSDLDRYAKDYLLSGRGSSCLKQALHYFINLKINPYEAGTTIALDSNMHYEFYVIKPSKDKHDGVELIFKYIGDSSLLASLAAQHLGSSASRQHGSSR
jgi:hypothetical protein